jgi:hypothetical protein
LKKGKRGSIPRFSISRISSICLLNFISIGWLPIEKMRFFETPPDSKIEHTVATKSIATFGFFHKDPMLNVFRAVWFFDRKE